MKKRGNRLRRKKLLEDKETDVPTQADGINVKEPLTKKQKFKNLFKLNEDSYSVLKYLFYCLMFVVFLTLFVVSTLPINMPTIILMISISMPFNSKYFKTGAWKSLYVIMPTIFLGGILNLGFFGSISVSYNITYTVIILFLSLVIQLLQAIFSKNKKEHLHNALVYLLTLLFWLGFRGLLMVL